MNIRPTLYLSLALLLSSGAVFSQEANSTAVTIVMSAEPHTLDPCWSRSSIIGNVIIGNITESLTTYDYGKREVAPKLAEQWEQIDPLTWRFHLRKDVTFQDGTPFNAAAVVAAVDRVQQEELGCPVRYMVLEAGGHITSTAVDDLTVDFATTVQNPIFPTLISTIQIGAESTSLQSLTREPVGTGPYRLAEWTPGFSIKLVRNENYWGDEPVVSGAEYIWRSESALRANMVLKGEADIAPVISVEDANNPATDFSYPNGETTLMRIDSQVAPLDDRRVRLALNLAVDKEGLKPLVGETAVEASQLVNPAVAGFNPNLKPFPFDPDQARTLLMEAKADGIDTDREIEVVTRSGFFPNSELVTEALLAMWKDVGFNVRLLTLDAANHNIYQNVPFPEPTQPKLVLVQHDNLLGDASFTAFNRYHSEGVNSATSDSDIDTWIKLAEQSSGDVRSEYFQRAFAKLHDEIISDVFLFHMVGYTRVNPRLKWAPSVATNSEMPLSEMSFTAN